MGTIFGREPAAIAAFLAIAINLAITFGLSLTVEQISLINALVVAGLALIVRQGSTSLVAPKLAEGTKVEVVTPQGEPNKETVL
jgi:Na+/H+ antiporter NhaC